MNDQMQKEWQAWQKVVAELTASGATTEADWKAPLTQPPTTSGQTLIRTIMAWGDELAKLRIEQAGK